MLAKFNVRGNLRFISHSEALRIFQRAFARTGMKIKHSQGFNPRPKLSIPLPRSVGVESEGDLICLKIEDPILPFDKEQFKNILSCQLPEGIELTSVSIAEKKGSSQPIGATYLLAVQKEYIVKKLKSRAEFLLASDKLILERKSYPKGKSRHIDIRPFLISIEFNNTDLAVECEISPTGSIRVDEILDLLQLNVEDLVMPIKRTNVKWKEA